MPYVDINRDEDFVSFWYITNSYTGHASSFDPQKPTILLLHPHFLDTTWLSAQFGDPRLSRGYNLIAYDARAGGKTVDRYSGRQDAWTDAVDIALFIDALCLPPVHVWASEAISVDAAVRFAILFPELCLSLALLSPTPLDVSDSTVEHDELMEMWACASDLETLEFALFQLTSSIIGTDIDNDLADELLVYFEINYPPFRAARQVQIRNRIRHRQALTREDLARIRVPCLLIHGDDNQIHPLKYARRAAAALVNARGGAKLVEVKGGQGYISIVPRWADMANRYFAQFLAKLPRVRTVLRIPSEPIDHRLRRALRFFAELVGEERLAETKDPLSSLTFSRVSLPIQKQVMSATQEAVKQQKGALSPLDGQGRPIRRYSERIHEHWFQGDRHNMSYAKASKMRGCAEERFVPWDERGDCTPQEVHAGPPTVVRNVATRGIVDKTLANSLARVEQTVLKSNLAKAATVPKLLQRS